MKQFSLKLRKILLFDALYYILLILTIIYLVIYNSIYECSDIYKENQTIFELNIKNYKIDGDKLLVEFNNLIGVYYFKSKEEKQSFYNYSLNDLIQITGKLTKPNNNTIINTFNYKEYLKHKDIKYILEIDSYKKKQSNRNIFYKIKNYFYKRINNIDNNEYLYAFILGNSSYINTDTFNNYKTNGVTHLFALSGLHVSLFSSIIISLLKRLKLGEKSSFIITSIFLLFFSFIASFTPSILRAVIFFILNSLNNIYYLYIKPKYLLFITFVILVLINPLYIFNTGFILSFTITFFILLSNENIEINGSIKSTIYISFLSFLSSIPIIINSYFELNIIGFINNIVFIPLVSYIIFPLSLISTLINSTFLLNIFTSLMEFISKISSNILNISIYFQKLNCFEIIIYYLLLILIIKNHKKLIKIFIIFIILIYLKPLLNNDSLIYFIDVNQGDSTLVIDKNKSTLIDTGGVLKYNNSSWKKRNKQSNKMTDSLIPFFKSIGLKKIDNLIITHGDYDHMGEAISLVNNFKVEKVIFNCGPYNDLEQELIKVLDKKKIKYYSCIKELNIDKNKLYFLQTNLYDNENDNSNVIYTELYGYKFMFMGDAEIEKEKDILDKYNISNIDVLKVGHHGSNTSSGESFINRMNPKYSIISVGNKNKYGHPNKEVLDNLDESKIYRTDQDGSIMFKIKNNKLKVETCAP